MFLQGRWLHAGSQCEKQNTLAEMQCQNQLESKCICIHIQISVLAEIFEFESQVAGGGSLGPDIHYLLSGYPLAALEAPKCWLLPPKAKLSCIVPRLLSV